VNDFGRVIALAPDTVQAWLEKSFSLLTMGRAEEGLACCEEAIARWPDDPDFWHNKGTALEGLGRDAEAAAAYETARELDQRPD
jgi:Flp pilus assembly protein TadD